MKRFGFTLMEVAVSAALIAILAAATVPTFVDYLDMRNAETTGKALQAIATGIITFTNTVHTNAVTNTNTYPDSINYLTNPITTASRNSCGALWSGVTGGTAQLLPTFNSGFPYVSFYIPYGGYQTPIGLIDGIITRTPANVTSTTMSITMTGIDSIDATRLERYIDGDDLTATTMTTGTFRVTTFTGGGTTPKRANVGYVIPVAPKC